MKKKIINGFILVLSLGFILSLFFSCNNKKQNTENVQTKIKPKRIIKNKILIILGKEYYNRTGILRYMEEEYGLGQENPLLSILSYSDLIQSSRYPKLKLINEKIEEFKSDIVISIGIPEGAGKYLITASENNKDLIIINLLPMEETLPLEAASDLIVDFKPPTKLLNAEENFLITDDEIMLLLTAAVFAGEDINAKHKEIKISPIEEFAQAFFTARQVIDKNTFKDKYTVKPYIDSDTGIPSRKYLLIYKNAKEETNQEKGNPVEENSENEEITDPDKLEGGA